jgi:hypothetical protein
MKKGEDPWGVCNFEFVRNVPPFFYYSIFCNEENRFCMYVVYECSCNQNDILKSNGKDVDVNLLMEDMEFFLESNFDILFFIM